MTRIGTRKTVHPRKLKNTVILRKVSVFEDSVEKFKFNRKATIRRSRGVFPKLSALNKQLNSSFYSTCGGSFSTEFSGSLPLSQACTSTASINSYVVGVPRSHINETPQNFPIRKWNACKLEMTPDSNGDKNWKSVPFSSDLKLAYMDESPTTCGEMKERSQSDSQIKDGREKNILSTSSLPVDKTSLRRYVSVKRRKIAYPETPESTGSLESGSFNSRDCVDFSSIHKTPEVTAAEDVMAAVYIVHREFDEYYTGEKSVDVPVDWKTPQKCNFPPFFTPSATSTPIADLEWIGGLTSPRRLCEKPQRITVKAPCSKLLNLYKKMCGKSVRST